MNLKCIFLILVVTIACKSTNSELFQVDPRDWSENRFSLSEIADDIAYLPIDNKYPIRASMSSTPAICKDFILINVSDFGILAFDRSSGELIRKIGNRGRGPEEYMSGSFACDNKTGTIYVNDAGNKIKVYSEYGNYLKEIPLKQFGGNFAKVDVYDSKLFVSEFLIGGKARYNWIVLDTLGNIIGKKANSVDPFTDNSGLGGVTYKQGNKIYYCNFYNDTVFAVEPDLTAKAAFIFNRGEHRWPRGVVTPEKITQYIYPMGLFETKRFIVFNYGYNMLSAIAFIEKQSKEIFLFYRDGKSEVIINDIDNGIMFDPAFSTYFEESNKEYLVGMIEVIRLKAHLNSDEFRNSVPRYPEKKKELEKLADSLKETDNPVLVLVRLKE